MKINLKLSKLLWLVSLFLCSSCSNLPTCGSPGLSPNAACTYSFGSAFAPVVNQASTSYNSDSWPIFQSPTLQSQNIGGSNTNSYLINTPNGIRRCTVTSSGYTTC